MPLSPDICKGSTRVCSRLWGESQLCLAHLLRCSIILNNALHFEFSVSLFDFVLHSPAVLSPSPLLLEPPAHFFASLPPPFVNRFSIKCSKSVRGSSNVCFHIDYLYSPKYLLLKPALLLCLLQGNLSLLVSQLGLLHHSQGQQACCFYYQERLLLLKMVSQ